jgi:hypothetical protein
LHYICTADGGHMHTEVTTRPAIETDSATADRLETVNKFISSLYFDKHAISEGIASVETQQFYDLLNATGAVGLSDAVNQVANEVANQRGIESLLEFFKKLEENNVPFPLLRDIAICTHGVKNFLWIAVDTDSAEGERAELEILKAYSRVNRTGSYLSVQVVDAGDYDIPVGYSTLVKEGKPVGEQS